MPSKLGGGKVEEKAEKEAVKINQIISPACEKKCSMSDQRRVSYRKLTVLARRNLEEKAEKEAVKENEKKSVAASKFEEEETVFIDIPEPCVDARDVIVFGDKDRSHSISVNRVSCEDPEAAKMAEMEAAEYDEKRVNSQAGSSGGSRDKQLYG